MSRSNQLRKIKRKSKRAPFISPRIQNEIVFSLVERVGLFANTDNNINFESHLVAVREEKGVLCPSTSTMRRWYIHYQQFGEIPNDTKKQIGLNKKSKSRWWSEQQLSELKEIVDYNPHFYLDEISTAYHQRFPNDKKSTKSIWKALHDKLNYRFKVYTEIALQRNEEEHAKYKHALKLMLRNPQMAILIDETSKDKNTGRRRRMWALRGKKAEWKAIFAPENVEGFLMIGAADVNGFVPDACELVFKGRGDDSHPVCGNIDGVRFRDYVKYRLCPVLGNYLKGEPHLVVILDNAAIHMHPEFEELINSKGAILLYAA